MTESKAYVRIMQLFNGAAIGSDLAGVADTRWAMLNAVTELVTLNTRSDLLVERENL